MPGPTCRTIEARQLIDVFSASALPGTVQAIQALRVEVNPKSDAGGRDGFADACDHSNSYQLAEALAASDEDGSCQCGSSATHITTRPLGNFFKLPGSQGPAIWARSVACWSGADLKIQ